MPQGLKPIKKTGVSEAQAAIGPSLPRRPGLFRSMRLYTVQGSVPLKCPSPFMCRFGQVGGTLAILAYSILFSGRFSLLGSAIML